MGAVTTMSPSLSDDLLLRLAREIAMDIHPLHTILETTKTTFEQWETIKENPRFQALLASETEAWNTALNTHERVKIKAAAMMEEWLPELFSRLHDNGEALPAKIEGGKLLAKIAEIGNTSVANPGAAGERFSVTIHLGADSQLKFEHELPSKVIEHDPSESS